MKRNELANCITLTRILAAPLLLWTEPLSLPFYALFLFCGVTDMMDGFVARKTTSESRIGMLLDSLGDMVFVVVCLVKLLPVIELPLVLWIWIGMIALLRAINLLFGYVYR